MTTLPIPSNHPRAIANSQPIHIEDESKSDMDYWRQTATDRRGEAKYWQDMCTLYADERNELREQLAEAQDDVRALIEACEAGLIASRLRQSDHDCHNDACSDAQTTALIKAVLARPGVKRPMRDPCSSQRSEPIPPYDACSPLHHHEAEA